MTRCLNMQFPNINNDSRAWSLWSLMISMEITATINTMNTTIIDRHITLDCVCNTLLSLCKVYNDMLPLPAARQEHY